MLPGMAGQRVTGPLIRKATVQRFPYVIAFEEHVIVEFSDERRALAFQRYLKSGSGNAFAKRHFK
jgi:hypothetical protein